MIRAGYKGLLQAQTQVMTQIPIRAFNLNESRMLEG